MNAYSSPLGEVCTPWTVLAEAASDDPAGRRAAMDRLAKLYWPSVYAYLRRDGLRADQAEDIAQGFFTDAVLGREVFQKADRSRGKLRALLLTALKNYRTDCARRALVRRETNACFASREREESLLAQDPAASAEDEFDRRLDLRIVEQAIERCERHFRAARRERHWALFVGRVLAPARGHAPPPPLESLAPGLGFSSPAAGAAAVQTVRLRLRMFIRQVVREHSFDEADARRTLDRLLPEKTQPR